MKYTAWMVVALLQELIFLGMLPVNESQRTHARQGIVREPPTVKLPGQGVLAGKEVRITRDDASSSSDFLALECIAFYSFASLFAR